MEELDEETVAEDDAELTLNKVDEEFVYVCCWTFLSIFTFGFISLLLIPLDFHFLNIVYFIVCRFKKQNQLLNIVPNTSNLNLWLN